MRIPGPLIVGGGPAGTAAAIALAREGTRATLFERQSEVGDAICGGFLSWHTLRSLDRLGVTPKGHPVDHVRLFARDRIARAWLPAGAIGLSRRALDTMMLARARDAGAAIEIAAVRSADAIDAESLFLATGKHELRGLARPRSESGDPALGLRIRMPAHPALTRLIGGAIELHLFDRGYAGLVLQEDGSANLCLAVRKSRLTEADGRPDALIRAWGDESAALGARLAFIDAMPAADAIAAVPYGWRATATPPGVFRLGDQAACIPSLAGEGIGIAVASGIAAARAWTQGGAAAAPSFQRAFAARTHRPVGIARLLWERGENPATARLALAALARAPALTRLLARLTRIGD